MNADTLTLLLEKSEGYRGMRLGECRVKGPVHEADHCSIYFAECSELPGPAAIKLCRSGPQRTLDPSSAAEQYEALKRLEQAWARNDSLQCVRPYALFEEQAALVLEWVPGRSLTDILLRLQTSTGKAHQLAEQAGQWLSAFHQLGQQPAQHMDVEQKRSVVQSMYNWPGAQDASFEQAIDSLVASFAEAASAKVEYSWIHGDFKLDNLLLDEERLTGIDIHLRHNNAVVYDIAPFLNHMEMSCLDPRNPWRFTDRDDLSAHFLAGYGREGQSPPPIALAWCRLFHLLCNWNSMLEHATGTVRRTLLHWAFSSTASRLRRQLAA
ncbi:MAG TPA: aminoglycoside phosphotransferase family protein [Burkholderiales bacterium]|nr:aminoglycoside phosphotransferase family protein [Burkholderiales bacterium]